MRITFTVVLCLAISQSAKIVAAQNPTRQTQPDQQFIAWDTNGDKQLSRDELPERIRGNFDRVDQDKDGGISLDEHLAFLGRGKESRQKMNRKRLPEGTRIYQDLVYVEGGHERHKLDLYVPATQANAEDSLPLVIWVHGGGWRKGSKTNSQAIVPLVEKGFAVASINYRLSEHAIFPAQIHDCKAAVRYLRKHASEHGINPDQFGVWGSSAGGHLVALLGTSGDVTELEGDLGVTGVSSRVQAVCDWYGPAELLKMNKQAGEKGKIDHDAADSPESKLIGGAIQENQEETRKADPITYVSSDDPPFLIMHGDQDPLVPYQQSEKLDQLLDDADVASRLIIVKGAGHGFKDPEQRQVAIDFFETQFLKKQKPEISPPRTQSSAKKN